MGSKLQIKLKYAVVAKALHWCPIQKDLDKDVLKSSWWRCYQPESIRSPGGTRYHSTFITNVMTGPKLRPHVKAAG